MNKKAGIAAGVIIILFSIGPCYSIVVSPPDAGKQAALEMSIPHRAVLAHRGLSWWAPETTVSAYILARDLGADYLEVDVQRTKDGVLIGFHDETPARNTNAADIYPGRENDPLGSFTLSELRKLDAGTWFNETRPERAREAWAGVKIITLEELIDIAEAGDNKPGLYIETKSADLYPGIEKQIIALLKKRGWIDSIPQGAVEAGGRVNVQISDGRIIFQSFVYESVKTLKELAPEVPRVYLAGASDVERLGWDRIIEKAAEADAGIGVSGHFAWPKYTGPAHSRGRLVHHYTINEAWQMRMLMFFGSDGIFTDRAELMLDIVKRERPSLDELFKRIE